MLQTRTGGFQTDAEARKGWDRLEIPPQILHTQELNFSASILILKLVVNYASRILPPTLLTLPQTL